MKDLSYGNGSTFRHNHRQAVFARRRRDSTAAIVTSTRAVVAFLDSGQFVSDRSEEPKREVHLRPSADHDDQHSEARVSSSLVFGVFTITVSAVIVIAAAAAAAANTTITILSSRIGWQRRQCGSGLVVEVQQGMHLAAREGRHASLEDGGVDRHCGWQRTQEAQINVWGSRKEPL